MQLKEINPINFVFFRTRTRVSELGRYVGIVARELYRDAALNNLEISGPIYWNYFGFEGDESKEFTLEIALPIAEIPKNYDGKFRVKREEAFHCVSIIHEGSWFDMPASYAKLVKYLEDHQLKAVAANRELYINMDFNNPAANVTEIQVGINPESYLSIINLTTVGDEVNQNF